MGLIDMGVFINMGTPVAGRFFMGNPARINDLGVPLFQETSLYIYIDSYIRYRHICTSCLAPSLLYRLPLLLC